MEGNPLRPLPGEGEAEDQKSRRKKELEEREARERVVKKPENLGFLAVESKPEEPSLVSKAWAETKNGPEDGQEAPSRPDDEEDPGPADIPPVVPPVETIRPAPEDDEEAPPPAEDAVEAIPTPVEDTVEQAPDSDASDEDEPPAPIEIPAEPVRIPEAEPVAARVEARDDDEDPGLEPEPPSAPEPEREAAPVPPREHEHEAAVEPELPEAAEAAIEPRVEEESDHGSPETSGEDEEELRIDHAREAEAPAPVEHSVEEQAASDEEAVAVPVTDVEAETESAPDPDGEESPVVPEEPEPERPQPEPAEARPFEFVEGGHDEDESSIAAEQAAEEEPEPEEQKAPEHIGHTLMNNEAVPGADDRGRPQSAEAAVVPETSRSSMAAETRMNVESAPKGPLAGIRIETLNRTELMDIARSVDIDGNNLLQIYETHLIGERGLRRLIIEYQKGGDLGEALKREVMEREMDFERDPAMRSLAPSSVTPSDDKAVDADNSTLEQLLKEANADADGAANSEEKAAFEEARTKYEATRGGSRERYRVIADAGFFLVIVILFLLVVIVYLRR